MDQLFSLRRDIAGGNTNVVFRQTLLDLCGPACISMALCRIFLIVLSYLTVSLSLCLLILLILI